MRARALTTKDGRGNERPPREDHFTEQGRVVGADCGLTPKKGRLLPRLRKTSRTAAGWRTAED